MKNLRETTAAKSGWRVVGLMAAVLAVLFWRSFLPDYVHFSNDGPLGEQNCAWMRLPGGLTGVWLDLNYVGASAGTFTLNLTTLLHVVFSPVVIAKFFPPVTLLLAGTGCVDFFPAAKIFAAGRHFGRPGGHAEFHFFCHRLLGSGLAGNRPGHGFFALALIVGCHSATPFLVRWTRLALAGSVWA